MDMDPQCRKGSQCAQHMTSTLQGGEHKIDRIGVNSGIHDAPTRMPATDDDDDDDDERYTESVGITISLLDLWCGHRSIL